MTPQPSGPDLDLGVIGNCQVAGLIDRLGRLVWGAFHASMATRLSVPADGRWWR
jgi:hypothetical protein